MQWWVGLFWGQIIGLQIRKSYCSVSSQHSNTFKREREIKRNSIVDSLEINIPVMLSFQISMYM